MSIRGLAPSHAAGPRALATALRRVAAANVEAAQPDSANQTATASRVPPLLVSRITNPTPISHILISPFMQVLAQPNAPVPGRTYNVYYVSMRYSTNLTYDAGSGFSVRFSGQTKAHAYPILTGDQKWLPNQVMVFYVLTKQYYPARPVVSGGFEFDLGGSRGVAIGGPSAVFLRIKYDPAKFPRILDWIVVNGPGSKGHRRHGALGIHPDGGPMTAPRQIARPRLRRLVQSEHKNRPLQRSRPLSGLRTRLDQLATHVF